MRCSSLDRARRTTSRGGVRRCARGTGLPTPSAGEAGDGEGTRGNEPIDHVGVSFPSRTGKLTDPESPVQVFENLCPPERSEGGRGRPEGRANPSRTVCPPPASASSGGRDQVLPFVPR